MNEYDKLKKIQKMILHDVSEICEKNHLRYYMIGGTLLGAVRHRGFIPWDDDIDIGMFRSDYDRLFHIMREQYAEKYFVQSFETDKNYTRYIMKIRLNGTILKESANENIEMNHGIYIDVLPLDYISDDERDLVRRGKIIRWLFALKNVKHGSKMRTVGKKVLAMVGKIVFALISDQQINLAFKTVCEKDNQKCRQYITIFASHYGWKRQKFPASYYGEGCMLLFEGELYRGPTEYDKILTQLFGKDYMQMPSKEKQIQHKIISLDFGKYDSIIENG